VNIEIALMPLINSLESFIWPFVRIGAFVMVMPVIGSSFVPARVRLLLAVALTGVIAPLNPTPVSLDVLSAAGLVTVIQEIAIGATMGFLVQLVFDAIALGGQVIGMSMGLGFAVFLDRARGVNMPVLGQLFLMLGMLVFLCLDGHLALISLLAQSFTALPITSAGLNTDVLAEVLLYTGQLFVFAMKIALPAITAILVVNLAFGVMSRAAPTLNLFAIGFPVTMLLGFAVIFLSMDALTQNVSLFLGNALSAVAALIS
jgi:flagellar biosynthetic protein FliR